MWSTTISHSAFRQILKLAQDYYEGMIRGRADILERVFEPDARFQGVRDGEQVRRGLPEFIAMAAGADAASGTTQDWALTVDLIDVTGPIALVKVTDRFRGRTYVDYLMLVKNGEWQIVNKTFTIID